MRLLGWTWISDQNCPMRVVGKRCRIGYPGRDECLCENWDLKDHGATLKADTGRFVLWEPYSERVTIEALHELATAAAELGITVSVGPPVWFTPYTVGIRFERAHP